MKRALCVGVNKYPGTNGDLLGCVNDAHDWAAALTAREYAVDTIVDKDATRQGILAHLTALVEGTAAGWSLVFTFSGHGSWLPDTNGDEVDGRDELLCPYDVASGQYILDDDLARVFGMKHRLARLYMIADCCHSGTITRFAPEPAFQGGPLRVRYLPPLQFVPTHDESTRDLIPVAATTKLRRQPLPALLLSGCRDHEYSYDAYFAGRPNGALTRAALDTLAARPLTPQQWHHAIRARLPSRSYPQTPQLYGTPAAIRGAML